MNPRAPTNQSLQEIVILQLPVPVNCAQPYHKLIVQISTTFLPIGPTIKYARGLEIATLQLPVGTDKCVTELKAFKKKKKRNYLAISFPALLPHCWISACNEISECVSCCPAESQRQPCHKAWLWSSTNCWTPTNSLFSNHLKNKSGLPKTLWSVVEIPCRSL